MAVSSNDALCTRCFLDNGSELLIRELLMDRMVHLRHHAAGRTDLDDLRIPAQVHPDRLRHFWNAVTQHAEMIHMVQRLEWNLMHIGMTSRCREDPPGSVDRRADDLAGIDRPLEVNAESSDLPR